jgi:hypothetical protein
MLSDLGDQDASDVVRRRTFALPKFARFDQVVDPGRHLIISSRIIFPQGIRCMSVSNFHQLSLPRTTHNILHHEQKHRSYDTPRLRALKVTVYPPTAPGRPYQPESSRIRAGVANAGLVE